MAEALRDREVVLGYFFSNEPAARSSGVLPAPVLSADVLRGHPVRITQWDAVESNIPALAEAAPHAGAFNALPTRTAWCARCRSWPNTRAAPTNRWHWPCFAGCWACPPWSPVCLGADDVAAFQWPGEPAPAARRSDHRHPVDERVSALVPFRGRGGPEGGSFAYVSAAEVLSGRLAPEQLRARSCSWAPPPRLQDLRLTPVGARLPRCRNPRQPHHRLAGRAPPGQADYALGYELVVLVVSGLCWPVPCRAWGCGRVRRSDWPCCWP